MSDSEYVTYTASEAAPIDEGTDGTGDFMGYYGGDFGYSLSASGTDSQDSNGDNESTMSHGTDTFGTFSASESMSVPVAWGEFFFDGSLVFGYGTFYDFEGSGDPPYVFGPYPYLNEEQSASFEYCCGGAAFFGYTWQGPNETSGYSAAIESPEIPEIGVGGVIEDASDGSLLSVIEDGPVNTGRVTVSQMSGTLYLSGQPTEGGSSGSGSSSSSRSGDPQPYVVPRSVPVYLSGSALDLGVARLGFLPDGPTFGITPNTNAATTAGLPNQEASALGNMAQNQGPPDGVSRSAPPSPTATLTALAAAGRNPTDLTIPTVGSQAGGSGGDSPDTAGTTVTASAGGITADGTGSGGGGGSQGTNGSHLDPNMEGLKAGVGTLGPSSYNVVAGAGKTIWDLGAVPFDFFFGTEYSYYGAASAQALRQGASPSEISADTALNIGTFGLKPLGESAVNYYETGDPTQFQQTSGSFLVGTLAAKGTKSSVAEPLPESGVPAFRAASVRLPAKAPIVRQPVKAIVPEEVPPNRQLPGPGPVGQKALPAPESVSTGPPATLTRTPVPGSNSYKPDVMMSSRPAKRHGWNWSDADAKARAVDTGNPQGRWGSKPDADYAMEQSRYLQRGETTVIDAPPGSNNVLFNPDGTVVPAPRIFIMVRESGVVHAFPVEAGYVAH